MRLLFLPPAPLSSPPPTPLPAPSPKCPPRRPTMTTTGFHKPSSSPFPPAITDLENEGAYAVMAAAAQLESTTGRAVVHLEIGQPAFPTPAHVRAAAAAALEAGKTKYVAPAGVSALRARIAARTAARARVDVPPEAVVVGPGAKPGLFFATLALVRGREDEVVVPDPAFPTYAAMVEVAGGTVRKVRMDGELRCFDGEALERAVGERTRLLVLNSPGNPTGGVARRGDLERIAGLAKRFDFYVMADEIYSRLLFEEEDEYVSILSLPGMAERTIVVDGFSKAYSMTGFRLGWAVMPLDLAARVELLLVHSVGCTASFVQEAGIAALEGPDDGVREMRDEYRRRRDIVVDGLNAIPGVYCRSPDGAFYAFADVSSFGKSCRDIADLLLMEGFVAVLPGTDFGEGGEGFIRISYVSDETELREGLKRIAAVLSKLPIVEASSSSTAIGE